MTERPRFTERVVFLCPTALSERIEQAAERELMTTSEYIRRAIIERLGEQPQQQHEAA